MKVALFVHCFFPDHFYGTETYTLEVARNLMEMGLSPVVVSAVFAGEPERHNQVTRYEYEKIPVYCIDKNSLPFLRIRDSYYQRQMYDVLKGVLQDIRPDLVHVAHLGNHTAVLLEVLDDLDIPVIATLTDFFGICFTSRLEAADGSLCPGPNPKRTNCIACALKGIGQNHPDKLMYRWLANSYSATLCAPIMRLVHPGFLADVVRDIEQRPDVLAKLYSHYRVVIAPTRFLAKAYSSNGLQVPMRCMHFGVDIDEVVKIPSMPDSPLRFGFIGQLAAHKGPDILLEAFAKLPPGSAELLVYGTGDTEGEYVSALKSKAEGQPVDFRGTFPSNLMAGVLAELDFLVIPSRWYENSPLVLLSALASHTPVIVSDVEGMAEFVEHGSNGYLFGRGNSDALYKVLCELVDDPVGARGMSAQTSYTRSTRQMTEELVEIYNSIFESV